MLYRLMYSSVAVVPLDEKELEALLGISRERNQAADITGLLVHVRAPETVQAAFVQVLEGTPDAVQETYARIQRDDLHHDLVVLSEGPVAARSHAGWSMRLEEVPLQSLITLTSTGSTPGTSLDLGPTIRDVVRDHPTMTDLVSQYA